MSSHESSGGKENRIRRAEEFADQDVGTEGHKSTYLRPSHTKDGCNELNRSFSAVDKSKASLQLHLKAKAQDGQEKKKRSKNNGQGGHKLNTCRAQN
jgi:hypothetical protein